MSERDELGRLTGRRSMAEQVRDALKEPRPDAPLDVRALPDYWDRQRALEGKDPSQCAAELRRALASQGDAP